MMKQQNFASHTFCGKYVVGMIRMIQAWNNIARKGIPNALHASNCINRIHSLKVPPGDDAIEQYRRQLRRFHHRPT